MADKTAILQIQLRRGAAAAWTSADTVLLEGEVGYETDTGFFKWGDGSTAWTSLEYSTVKTKTTRVTTTYQILVTDQVIHGFTDGGTFTVTLPAGVTGQSIRVVNTGAAYIALTVAPSGAEELLGENSNFTLWDGESLELVYDTDGWY